MIAWILTAYAAVAGTIAMHVLYHGVVLQPRDRMLTGADQTILAATAVFVGAFWALFMPALAVHATRRALRDSRHVEWARSVAAGARAHLHP